MLAVSFGRLSSDRQGFKTANGDERSNLSRFSPGCDQATHSRYAVIALPGMLFLPASEPADQEQSRLGRLCRRTAPLFIHALPDR
jgi:hypothetical protein